MLLLIMLFQRSRIETFKVTYSTTEFYVLMNSSDMLLQLLNMFVAFITMLTIELYVLMQRSNVNPQTMLILGFKVAMRTLVTYFPMSSINVNIKLLFCVCNESAYCALERFWSVGPFMFPKASVVVKGLFTYIANFNQIYKFAFF